MQLLTLMGDNCGFSSSSHRKLNWLNCQVKLYQESDIKHYFLYEEETNIFNIWYQCYQTFAFRFDVRFVLLRQVLFLVTNPYPEILEFFQILLPHKAIIDLKIHWSFFKLHWIFLIIWWSKSKIHWLWALGHWILEALYICNEKAVSGMLGSIMVTSMTHH